MIPSAFTSDILEARVRSRRHRLRPPLRQSLCEGSPSNGSWPPFHDWTDVAELALKETVDWTNPAKWNRGTGWRACRVFSRSESDLFTQAANGDRGMEIIKNALTWIAYSHKTSRANVDRLPLDWHRLSKRVWLGVTCGCAKSLSRQILRDFPSVVKFVLRSRY